MKWQRILLAVAFIAAFSAVRAIAEPLPTMDQVYQTARAGDLVDADHMMRQVLIAHPASAKAHYVYADILAQEGYKSQARDELSTAERLAPGLPFVTPQAISHLEHELSMPRSAAPSNHYAAAAPVVNSGSHLLLIFVLGVIVIAILVLFIYWINDSNRRWYSLYHEPSPTPPDCTTYGASSRVCERGTRGCNTYHDRVGGTHSGAPVSSTTIIRDGSSNNGMVDGIILGSMMNNNRGETIINNNAPSNPGATPPPASEPAPDSAPDQSLGGNDFGVDQGSPTGKESWDDSSQASPSDPEPSNDSWGSSDSGGSSGGGDGWDSGSGGDSGGGSSGGGDGW